MAPGGWQEAGHRPALLWEELRTHDLGEPGSRPAPQYPITRSFWMDRMRLRAASQLARLPVMMMVSELLFSAGRSILVLLSSRIYKETGDHGNGRPS